MMMRQLCDSNGLTTFYRRQTGVTWIGTVILAGIIFGLPNLTAFGADNQRAETGPESNVLSLEGKPVVGRNANGLLEIFEVDQRGELRHRWQKPASGDWSAWSTLGKSALPGIAVATNAAGAIHVFALDATNHTLKCLQQRSPNGLDWPDWTNLGGNFRPPVAAGLNCDGRIEVFGIDAASGEVWHSWQTNVNAQRGWSGWASLGGNLDKWMIATRNSDGRLELFGVDRRDQSLVHSWQNKTNQSTNWSTWASLGGAVAPGFVAGQNVAGRLEVFAVDPASGRIQQISQTPAGSAMPWTPWADFGRKVCPGMAIGKSADGRLEVFAVDAADGMLLHRWEMMTNTPDLWSAWTSMDKRAEPFLAAGQNEDGDLEVFAADSKNHAVINHRRQISYSSDWLDWEDLNHATFEYSSRIWQTDEGLPDNRVQAIAQTPDGFLWVGTGHGLARFDGVNFTDFDARNTAELRNSAITALCTDRRGVLWIGTDGGGLVSFDGGSFRRFTTNNGLAGNVLKVIYESSDGSLWVGTTTGMSRYRDGKFLNYHKKDGLWSDIVSYIYEDHDGTIWIATGGGLNRLRGGEIMDSFAMPKGLPNDAVRGVWQDRGGRIWIASNNGMLWYNWYWTGSFFAYNKRYGLSDSFVTAIRDDREGNLWVGTYSGLDRFRDGRFFNELNDEGVPYGRVNALFEDRAGDLWVGSSEGLARLTPKRFFSYAKRQGLTHDNVTSVCEDRNGTIWAGTWGGGLDQLKDERVAAYNSSNGLASDLILSTCEGADGSIWIGADFDGGLTRLKDGKLTRYQAKDGLVTAPVRVLHEDRSERLWIGTSRGLSSLQSGRFINYTTADGLAGDGVRAICEDHAGVLWFGTEQGLSSWKDGKFDRFTPGEGLSDDVITALYSDNAKNLWIGTAGGGLNRYHAGRFTSYTTRQGLLSDEIFEILEDDRGWLWMSSSKGVFRVLKSSLDEFDHDSTKNVLCIAYGKADGMPTPQCNGIGKPAAWKAKDGRLWFATSKGLIAVDPKTIRINQTPPQVFIERLTADNNLLLPGALQVQNSKRSFTLESSSRPFAEGSVRLPAGRGAAWALDYTALNLPAPDKCRFKYRLEGVDSDWVDAGTRRTAYYNNVSPGNRRFRVIACNSDGVWNETGASLAIELPPNFWETWWFRGVGLLVIVGVASGNALILTRRRMQRNLEMLEQRHAVEKERARIAKDMHDQIGAGLTQVGLLGELVKREAGNPQRLHALAGKICDVTREQAQTLDEIVWAVDPKNDVLNSLAAYLAVYAEEIFRMVDVRCRLDIPPGLPPSPVSAEFRHNLFLTVKEALNNILKHAEASEVRVRLMVNGFLLYVLIEDNGKGFVISDCSPLGNGLVNMRERIEAMGGRFEISSKPDEGSRVSFHVPLDSILSANGSAGPNNARHGTVRPPDSSYH
jgi:ligand-binding sensor domain-containing protein/signal transduction histidine kinase